MQALRGATPGHQVGAGLTTSSRVHSAPRVDLSQSRSRRSHVTRAVPSQKGPAKPWEADQQAQGLQAIQVGAGGRDWAGVCCGDP